MRVQVSLCGWTGSVYGDEARTDRHTVRAPLSYVSGHLLHPVLAASRAEPFLEGSKGPRTPPSRASPSPLSTATGPAQCAPRMFAPNSREGVHGGRGIYTLVFYSRLGPHGYQPSAGEDTMLERDGMLPRELPGTESIEQCLLSAPHVFYAQIPFPSSIDQGVHSDLSPRLALLCLPAYGNFSRNSESGMRISTSAGPVCHSRISPRPRLSAQRPLSP